MMAIDPLVVLFGLGVGVLVGTTGMGGGSIMTPLLILVLGTQPVVAVGTDLAYAALTKTVGGWQHLRRGTVDVELCGWLAVGSLPGAVVGVWLVGRLEAALGPSFDTTLLAVLAGAILLTGVATLVRSLWPGSRNEVFQADVHRRGLRPATVVFGFLVGLVLATTSAGSGALIALGLILVYRLTPRRVVGTDVAHAALLLWVAGAGHVATGNVDLPLAGTILLGSLPGVWLGTRLSTRLPEHGLRPLLGVVLLAAGLGLSVKAGAPLPPAVMLGVPAAVGLAALLMIRARPRAALTIGGPS